MTDGVTRSPGPTQVPKQLLPRPPVGLNDKEQRKLDDMAGVVQIAQNGLAQAREALALAEKRIEQQTGRFYGALEMILDRQDLDPVKYQWNFDGQHVTVFAADGVEVPVQPAADASPVVPVVAGAESNGSTPLSSPDSATPESSPPHGSSEGAP